jgi:CRP/FNR family transcriptional regulator, anaerobic regulatory protein
VTLLDQLVEELDRNKAWEGAKIFNRNEFLVREGRTNTDLFYILSGSIRIFFTDGPEENIIRFGYRGSMISALDSYIQENPTKLSLQAIRKTEVKHISKERFMEVLNSSPHYKEIWIKLLEILILQQMEREQDLLTSSPAERYKRVLSRSPQLFQEVPHKYIASYLRMTPETLSRMKKS